MLTPEDSKRVADQMIESIKNTELRAKEAIDYMRDKIHRTDINRAVEIGVREGVIDAAKRLPTNPTNGNG